MPRAPRVTGDEVVAALGKIGWYVDHQKGSHAILERPTHLGAVTVPLHGGQILHPRTLNSILHQAGVSINRLRELLK